MLHHTTTCAIISHHTPSCSTMLHHTPPYSTMPHHAPSYSNIPHHAPSGSEVIALVFLGGSCFWTFWSQYFIMISYFMLLGRIASKWEWERSGTEHVLQYNLFHILSFLNMLSKKCFQFRHIQKQHNNPQHNLRGSGTLSPLHATGGLGGGS